MKNIIKGEDGVYRWSYEMSLFKNPNILFLIWKIFGCICLGMWLFNILYHAGDDAFWWSEYLSETGFFILFTIGILLFCLIGYVIYSLAVGGKFSMIYEMDDKGIRYTQMKASVKRDQVHEFVELLSTLTGRHTSVTRARVTSAAHSVMYTDFAKVRIVKAFPRRHIIRSNTVLERNAIYVDDDDFDFVLEHILGKVPPKQ